MPRKSQTTAQPVPDDDGFHLLDDVLEIIPVSKRTWWRGIAAGRYPKPVKLSPNVNGWRKRAIRQLCAELAAHDDNPAA